VQAGVLLGELDKETQAFGLAAPSGIVTHTGVSGLTLGGGIGWIQRKHGLSIDNLRSVDLVSADGGARGPRLLADGGLAGGAPLLPRLGCGRAGRADDDRHSSQGAAASVRSGEPPREARIDGRLLLDRRPRTRGGGSSGR
jgi:FAD/FMN-containing dehydrogenase